MVVYRPLVAEVVDYKPSVADMDDCSQVCGGKDGRQ